MAKATASTATKTKKKAPKKTSKPAAKKKSAPRKRAKKSGTKKSGSRTTAKKSTGKAASKRKAAKKPGKTNKLGVKNSLVNNINARKKKNASRPKSKSTVTKKSYKKMQEGWKDKK